MLIIKITTILLLSIFNEISASSEITNLCNISSDYLTNILDGIINEFKFKKNNHYKTNLYKMEETLKKVEILFGDAVKLEDFDSAILRLGHGTTLLKMKLKEALLTLDELGIEKDDSRIVSIVSLIKSEQFKEAFKSYKQMGNDGLLFTIVKETYFTTKHDEAVMKLIRFTNHLLMEDRIHAAVYVVIDLYHELIDSGNTFSFNMMYFAEFIARVMLVLNKDFKSNWEYQVLKGKLYYIELSVPRVVRTIVFYNMYHPEDWWCIKNKKWNEYLFIGELFHGNVENRRIVYTRNENELGNDFSSIRWKLNFDMEKVGYSLVNEKYSEYVYSTDNSLLYDSSNRFTFTRKEMASKSYEKAHWIIEPVSNEYFYIKNRYYDEYIYVPEQKTFLETYHVRRVFSYTTKKTVPNTDEQRWRMEKC